MLFNKKLLTYGNQYWAARIRVNYVIRTVKSMYFKRKIENNTIYARETCKIINKLLVRKSKTELPDKFIVRNEMVTDPLLIVNEFNYYFTSNADDVAEKFTRNDDYRIYTKNI